MQNSQKYSLDIVVPCYNEQDALPQSVAVILEYMRGLLKQSKLRIASFQLLLVDDGSEDTTWQIINELVRSNPELVGIKLSRNFGHQNALLAGLSKSTGDVCISIDADLQDDINGIENMLKAFEAGSDLALGVRVERTTDSGFKRISAEIYYKLLTLLGVQVIVNHADYRLLSRKALTALLAHNEINLYLRGIITALGFKTTIVPYSRQPRNAGETKYTTRKMIQLAIDGITSFSIVPLRLVTFMGSVLFVLSFCVGSYFLVQSLFAPSSVVPGWASTVLPLLFLGGMQLLSIGILGEYVGKIYMEVKHRPRFIIETVTSDIRGDVPG